MALDTSEWLVWLGVKEPQVDLSKVQGDINRLKDEVGDWGAFENLVDGAADYDELEQDLLDAGFPAAKVDGFISKIQDQYSSYSEFQDSVVNNLNSYDEFRSQFGNTQGLTGGGLTESGEPTAGLRVHDSAGTSYAGVSVPEGTTEIFGRRIEFSQQDASADPDQVGYSNQQASDTAIPQHGTITLSADVSNPNGWAIDVTVPLKEDGSVTQQESIRLPANGTVNVEFDLTKADYVCVDAAIGTLNPTTLCWTPPNLLI